ncbi:CaiB/BaiF CoA transferase family protein [Mesorhizobium sp. ANAO-SY3R2]|uniref:CaiB/BaiF CoA transferase family protein n=1 Tax=Mesorhizobium sp. ANAO-SY3R2 TaxID=3166644 RepID=UPI0036720359
MASGILSGIRVLDLTQNVAGPFCTQVLADFGAEVIKVERPQGGDDTRAWLPPEIGGESATFLALNRGKKSLAIDLSDPRGQEIVIRLAQEVDVLIHSLRPASAEKMGLGYEELEKHNPSLVYCAISAFGEKGPLRDLPGYDPLIQAFSGIMSVTGNEGDAPVRVSVSLVDMGTGMWSAIGILAALIGRGETGLGTKVEASLLDTGLSWMSVPIAGFLATGKTPQKLGSAMAMAAPYQLFRTLDGYVFIGAGNDRLFARVCQALDATELACDPKYATNRQRVAARSLLQEDIESFTQKRTTADLVAALRAVGAPCSELNELPDVLAHPQVAASEMILPLPTSNAADHRVVGTPLRLAGRRLAESGPPPKLGHETRAILTDLGIGEQELDTLIGDGVVAQHTTLAEH